MVGLICLHKGFSQHTIANVRDWVALYNDRSIRLYIQLAKDTKLWRQSLVIFPFYHPYDALSCLPMPPKLDDSNQPRNSDYPKLPSAHTQFTPALLSWPDEIERRPSTLIKG